MRLSLRRMKFLQDWGGPLKPCFGLSGIPRFQTTRAETWFVNGTGFKPLRFSGQISVTVGVMVWQERP
jgi:hypothetical protein